MMQRRLSGLMRAVCAVALLSLAACSSTTKPKPAELLAYTPALSAQALWSVRTDDVEFALTPAIQGGLVHVATTDGVVRALALDSGKTAWQLDLKTPLSAGVGSDGRWAAVVTRDNALVVMQQGRELWRSTLSARVVTAPLVAGERVFVVGVDRVVQAFDAATGQPLWTLKRTGDPLTLAQTGVLTAYRDTLLVGHGSRLLGVEPLKGEVSWEALLSSPRGTNEVERLADLVGPAARDGSVFCLRAFQNAVGCVDAARGAVQWSVPTGGRQGVALDADFLYATDGSDRVSARKRNRGEPVWTTEQLLNRGLSAPVVQGAAVVLGDDQGWLHWLARDTGRTLLRLPTDGTPVLATAVAPGGVLLAITARGGVFAFRVSAVVAVAPPGS